MTSKTILVHHAGAALLEARKHARLRQTDVALEAGVHENAILKWEHGYTDAHAASWIAAVNACGFDVVIVEREGRTLEPKEKTNAK